jgi:CHAT domain-containing protein
MAALWNVDDTPTSEFMVHYYRKMLGRRRLTPAAALRATQMEFLQDKRWQSPYFWAPFVIEGEWRGWQ